MIKTEVISATLTRTYSDAGMQIERDGIRYDEAVDPTTLDRVYTETDTPIDTGDGGEATLEDYQAALASLGIEEET